MVTKHVSWAEDTKTYDGNPKFQHRYDETTGYVREKHPNVMMTRRLNEDETRLSTDQQSKEISVHCSPK